MKQTSRNTLIHWLKFSGGMTAVFLLAFLMPGAWIVHAQNGGRASFTAPVLTDFPEVSFFLSAFDATGSFMDDLAASHIKITEDGQPLPAKSLDQLEPGLQIIVAMNSGPAMANRFAGKSRFEGVQTALLDWMATQPATVPDDLSLISNTGLLLARSNSPQEWRQTLQDFKPDLLNARPGISGLSQALDMTIDPNPRPNMKRIILYITVIPDSTGITALPNLAARARRENATIHVWLVGPPLIAQVEPAGYKALEQLALDTGGQMFLYTGQNTLPDPENYFKPLRFLYQVSYLSAVRSSGEHRLGVSIEQPELILDAGSTSFTLNISAPNPILLSPPAEIQRSWVDSSAENTSVLTPVNQELQILVEFTDNLPRELSFSRLFVDGALMDENLSPPFDQFNWNLQNETSAAQRKIQVEVGDVFGFTQKTIEFPVSILVAEPPRRSLLQNIAPEKVALYVGILLAGAALVVTLLFAGRKMKRRSNRQADRDPLTQPVPIRQERSRKPAPLSMPERPAWLGHKASTVPVRLVRFPQGDAHSTLEAFMGRDLALDRRETTLGSDAHLAMVVLNSPAVSGLHARVLHTPDGKYMLADAGSVAGTWVNYAPVSQQGAHLEHGDLVHIGPLAYRFELATPPKQRAPRSSAKDETP